MKWLQALRAILNLLYFFSWITALCSPLIIVLAYQGIPIEAAGFNLNLVGNRWHRLILGLCICLGYFFYLAMIHFLKKAAFQITPSQLLSKNLHQHLFKAGMYCLIGLVLTKIPVTLYKYVVIGIINNDYQAINQGAHMGASFDSFLVIVCFGLFMIIFSKITERSLQLQEEQALTV